MELKQWVVSLELAKKLKELGVRQESYFVWSCFYEGQGIMLLPTYETQPELTDVERYAAFTMAELREKLPSAIVVDGIHKQIFTDRFHDKWLVGYTEIYDDDQPFMTTEADARAKMLIYLVENNHIIM